tara:strand:+ start:7995 stop:8147 length:153 start_codon:yes stop_codon:yes gene_type:complete
MEKEIELLNQVYSSVMSKIDNKDSDKLYRISQVQNILTQIDDLQYNLNDL